MKEYLIEAESFSDLGGWVVDTSSAETLHSAYLMAHGMGIPVPDAVTELEISETGNYNIWALTRDWTAVWNAPDPAGKFQILADQVALDSILGTNGWDWSWQKAGQVCLEKGKHSLALRDLTGFNGRCDAIYITASEEMPSSQTEDIDAMRQRLNWKDIRENEKTYDLVVVGGGIAGICTALAAMHSGVSVALIHDRAILGGCNSSEVRVCMGGVINLPPYENLGNVVKTVAPVVGYPSSYGKEYFEDDRKRLAFEVREHSPAEHKLFLEEMVTDVECENGVISSVICTNARSGRKTRIRGRWFSDCSGDGILSRKAGCQVMYGREASREFGESLAPSERQDLVMGHSIRWYSEKRDQVVPFPDIDWGLHFSNDTCLDCTSGDWEQETGFEQNTVKDIEYIRDFGLRAIYSNWAFQKNHYKNKEKFAYLALKWVSPIGGKREGYRVKGDYVLTQRDLEERISHEDGTACITWDIDMHFPEPQNKALFGEAFRSCAYHRGIGDPYPVPYRCLYAKDAENLFLGGGIVSTSHVAFSAVRVMRTLGELGEVVGLACSVCKKYGCNPRQVYTEHLGELKAILTKGVRFPDSFEGKAANNESYHFKDIGWWHLHLAKAESPSDAEKFKRRIATLGLEHKNPMPEKWE